MKAIICKALNNYGGDGMKIMAKIICCIMAVALLASCSQGAADTTLNPPIRTPYLDESSYSDTDHLFEYSLQNFDGKSSVSLLQCTIRSQLLLRNVWNILKQTKQPSKQRLMTLFSTVSSFQAVQSELLTPIYRTESSDFLVSVNTLI